ncbi:uncharacterized protein [Ptychodera flava]|uniref:uncharacterized protein n=1 Tax=Ptychodera flava TaxID=63121 RepID=UPI003969EC04
MTMYFASIMKISSVFVLLSALIVPALMNDDSHPAMMVKFDSYPVMSVKSEVLESVRVSESNSSVDVDCDPLVFTCCRGGFCCETFSCCSNTTCCCSDTYCCPDGCCFYDRSGSYSISYMRTNLPVLLSGVVAVLFVAMDAH